MRVLFQLLEQVSIHISKRKDSIEAKRTKTDKRIETQFLDKISGLVIIKLLDKLTQSVLMLKVKFMQNTAMLDMINSSSKILILSPKEALGILDLRSLGYYKIKQ